MIGKNVLMPMQDELYMITSSQASRKWSNLFSLWICTSGIIYHAMDYTSLDQHSNQNLTKQFYAFKMTELTDHINV